MGEQAQAIEADQDGAAFVDADGQGQGGAVQGRESPCHMSGGQEADSAPWVAQPDLSAAEINVETFKGRVQLSGFVGTQADINKAVAVTQAISGVRSVKNDMRLK